MHNRILLVVGTRPEAIKLAPVYRALQTKSHFEVRIAVTGQHREMLDDALATFQITPDYDLALMREAQTPSDLIALMLPRLNQIITAFGPSCIVVQGDTTTTFGGALAGYLRRILVVHVEAGLRTGDKYAPYPEEVLRRMVADIADLHFAPTAQARHNLLKEGIADSKIHVTGNTAIDAIRWVLANTPPIFPATLHHLGADFMARRFVLVTCHRRESFGPELESIMTAIANLAAEFQNLAFLFPVHLNPNVQRTAHQLLGELANVHLCKPLPYGAFAHVLNACYFVMTDSGGIQEEAAELGKPVLVMRRTTERGEGIAAGAALLVGMDAPEIESQARRLLCDEAFYQRIAVSSEVYGDGAAALQIAEILEAELLIR